MDIISNPSDGAGKEIHPDFQDLYENLVKLYNVGQFEGEIIGVEVSRQGEVSNFESPGRRVSIWKDEGTAEIHALLTCAPPLPANGYQRLRQIDKTSTFSIKNDGTPGHHTQNWGGDNDLDLHDQGFESLVEVVNDLDSARKATLEELSLRSSRKTGIYARIGRFVRKVF